MPDLSNVQISGLTFKDYIKKYKNPDLARDTKNGISNLFKGSFSWPQVDKIIKEYFMPRGYTTEFLKKNYGVECYSTDFDVLYKTLGVDRSKEHYDMVVEYYFNLALNYILFGKSNEQLEFDF